jgi:hypothetical protein
MPCPGADFLLRSYYNLTGDAVRLRSAIARRTGSQTVTHQLFFIDSSMFEQTFKNIDDVLWKESGCATELDDTEQTSWLLFLKSIEQIFLIQTGKTASLFLQHFMKFLKKGGRAVIVIKNIFLSNGVCFVSNSISILLKKMWRRKVEPANPLNCH